ncbi:MAG TPA: SIR2 family protein [Pyrinomonadaceae bacterium]|nr:SIR2 family protein [Pyrinomonadaceae bacterium]
MQDALQMHYEIVVNAMADGDVIPFFGAGVNLCGRPPGTAWQRDQSQYLPSGGELSAYLARNFRYPQAADAGDLVRVSQYVSLMRGSGPLYRELRQLFDADYPPTSLHHFFAGLPSALRAKNYDPPPHQLIVTTNYDDLMEGAYFAARVPFDLVAYVAEGQNRGKFWHWAYAPEEGREEEFWSQKWPPPVKARLIERPNEDKGIALDEDDRLFRPVILKIHGAVDRAGGAHDSYVITEDHYIDYLTRADISSLVPATLVAKLKGSSFLFLGYSLRDWNLRVILQRIWGEQQLTFSSWAVQLNPPELDRRFWSKRNVEILNVTLEQYVEGLAQQVAALPALGGDV